MNNTAGGNYPVMILANHNVVGTCGSCGGAVVSPMMTTWNSPPVRFCQSCGKHAKPQPPITAFGPILEML